jgi:CubicO group peptidase (beta-lactamase class C family)
MSQTLERATPESVGISSAVLLEWVNRLESAISDPRSLMVVRHGKVVAEGWWAPNGPKLGQMLFSLSKSFTSTAVGMAIAEGRFGLDDPVVSFFPDDLPAEVTPHLAAMKVRHLLAMCTGHSAATINGAMALPGENWVGNFLAQPISCEPGTSFAYNTPATYMLSAIVQKQTGQKLVDYLRPRLFEPLGIENPQWEECPRGINTGGFGLQVRTEDIAKFGQLCLQKGMWDGKQLVPTAWVEAATSKQIDNAPHQNLDWAQGYGYQFWRGRHGSYRGDGAFGQYCIVVPARDLVIAVTSGTDSMQLLPDLVWDVILPGLRPAALPPNKATHSALTSRLADLRLVPRAGATSSPMEASLGGAIFKCGPNQLGLKSVQLEFTSNGGALLYGREGPWHMERLDFRRSAWRPGTSDLVPDWQGKPLAASAAWPKPDQLELDVCLYSTPFRFTLTFDFSGAELRLSLAVNFLFGANELGAIKGTRAGAIAEAP